MMFSLAALKKHLRYQGVASIASALGIEVLRGEKYTADEASRIILEVRRRRGVRAMSAAQKGMSSSAGCPENGS